MLDTNGEIPVRSRAARNDARRKNRPRESDILKAPPKKSTWYRMNFLQEASDTKSRRDAFSGQSYGRYRFCLCARTRY